MCSHILQKAQSKKGTTKSSAIDIDMSASDSETAIRAVKAREEESYRLFGQRGPKTTALLYYTAPEARVVNGKDKWYFKCLHCPR